LSRWNLNKFVRCQSSQPRRSLGCHHVSQRRSLADKLTEWLAHYIVRSALIIYSITSASRPNPDMSGLTDMNANLTNVNVKNSVY